MSTRSLITIGTDGSRDWVRLPDGRTFTLGTVSVLKLVVELAPSAVVARRTLDDFLANGESMMTVDLDELDALVQKPRARWATNTLIPGADRRASAGGSTMEETDFEKRLAAVERHLHTLAGVKVASELPEWMMDSLVDAVRDLAGTRTAAERSESTARRILATLSETADRVDILESVGKPVNATAVRVDLHRVATRVAELVAHEDLGSVADELASLQATADEIHSYFV